MKIKNLTTTVSIAIVFLAIACNPPKEESDPLIDLLTISAVSSTQREPFGNLSVDFVTKCGTGVTCSNTGNTRMNFGNIHVHTSSIANVTTSITSRNSIFIIRNSGPGSITLTTPDFTNSQYTFSPTLNSLGSRVLLANESLEVTATFTPSSRSSSTTTFFSLSNRNNTNGEFPTVSLSGAGNTYAASICSSGQTAVRARNLETTTRTIYLFTTSALCQANNTGTSNANASLTFSSVAPNGVTAYQCVASRAYFLGDGNGAGGCTTASSDLRGDNIITNSTTTISAASE